MIIDSKNNFGDNITVPKSTGAAVMGDVIDFGQKSRMGDGTQMYVIINVKTTFTSGGSATVKFALSTGSANTLGTDLAVTKEYAVADLKEGEQISIAIPQGVEYQRWLGIRSTVGTANLTAGVVSASLSSTVPGNWYAPKDGKR